MATPMFESLLPIYICATDPVKKVTLASSDLEKSVNYWSGLLQMKVHEKSDNKAVLGFGDDQAKLELLAIGRIYSHVYIDSLYKLLLFGHIGSKVEHAKAFGRVAFSCPSSQLPDIEASVKKAGETILTPLVSLDTPGEATVQVVILADPVSQLHKNQQTQLNLRIKIGWA